MSEQQVRDALEQALKDVGAAPGSHGTLRHSERVKYHQHVVSKGEADPRFKAYGEQLLAACRVEGATVDWPAFYVWRSQHPELQGVGAITLLRLWKAWRES